MIDIKPICRDEALFKWLLIAGKASRFAIGNVCNDHYFASQRAFNYIACFYAIVVFAL